ncbi:hypothetical protein BKA64DRAFT_179780 [Cadophora sp. MPI-SDFR-AT-0126]|nr:hypothetical protein BKA64DRAFT_179780 [Leotiomycetes sp. MPI-SDFR-AT-0126]
MGEMLYMAINKVLRTLNAAGIPTYQRHRLSPVIRQNLVGFVKVLSCSCISIPKIPLVNNHTRSCGGKIASLGKNCLAKSSRIAVSNGLGSLVRNGNFLGRGLSVVSSRRGSCCLGLWSRSAILHHASDGEWGLELWRKRFSPGYLLTFSGERWSCDVVIWGTFGYGLRSGLCPKEFLVVCISMLKDGRSSPSRPVQVIMMPRARVSPTLITLSSPGCGRHIWVSKTQVKKIPSPDWCCVSLFA